ncbi:TetR/AcrR family transcriptional regulator [Nocardioides ferulae]|uniref:TetR/AcrR family transcriptional regulator n=1 Tax=Nocardioides ferulae TaxID=2340821 RepID=UPI000EAF3C3A|nr:TetR family transcriptional regulator [Nocardioides ferulae]
MPRKTRRVRADGEQTRRRILDATLAIATEHGYDGTSIGRIRKATGIPASSIYWHFRDKDDLLAEALTHGFASWRAETQPDFDPTHFDLNGPDGAERAVRTRLHWAARAMAESPAFWRLGIMLAITSRVPEPAARRRYLEVRRQTQQQMAAWWAPMMPRAAARDPELPLRLARVHLALIDGLFVGALTGRGWDLQQCADVIGDGLLAFLREAEGEPA